jgi:hypothetical protein
MKTCQIETVTQSYKIAGSITDATAKSSSRRGHRIQRSQQEIDFTKIRQVDHHNLFDRDLHNNQMEPLEAFETSYEAKQTL